MKRCVVLLLAWIFIQPATAQERDSVLTFQAAKARLMRANLVLLAAFYDVDIAKAQVIQARTWANPNFIINGDMYNSETNEYFKTRAQHLFQLEHTISYAGKHTNTVKLARINAEMAEKQLQDVLRSLLYELGNTYADLAALQAKGILYQQVIVSYQRLMEATEKQLSVGAISNTEALRLQSEYLAVQTDAIANFNEKEQALATIRTLLRYPADTVFQVEQRLPLIQEEFDLNVLTEQAVTSRPDLEVKKINKRYQERNLKLQKSTAFPDIGKLGYQPQDRGSNYQRPYKGYTFEINLPIFDRNQGRIKQAQFAIKQSELQYEQLENQVRNEVTAAFKRYRSSNAGLGNYGTKFLDDLNTLNKSTNENFQKRNIGLLQFIDQQRIYIQTNIQLIELKQQYLNNVNELNFTIGTNLIEY